MKQKLTVVLFIIFSACLHTYSQDSTLTKALSFSGYVESYYSYDFSKPASNTRPDFIYSHNRHNEININLALLKLFYIKERYRANLAVSAGTYTNANYAQENGLLRNLFEANVGFKLSAKKNLWLDMGILPSHIGFESAIGKDNWALSRSLVAENSPYYETGARLTYTTDNDRLSIALLALNGWQRITRVEGNSLMSAGAQVFYKPNDRITLNYSNFFGTDKPDSVRLLRHFHNVYGVFALTEKIGVTLGFDIGQEQKQKSSSEYNTWYAPVAILRAQLLSQWAVALRGEYFNDKNSVLYATGTPNGNQLLGLSANVDFIPFSNAMLRLEFRNFTGKDAMFVDKDESSTRSNNAITFSAMVAF